VIQLFTKSYSGSNEAIKEGLWRVGYISVVFTIVIVVILCNLVARDACAQNRNSKKKILVSYINNEAKTKKIWKLEQGKFSVGTDSEVRASVFIEPEMIIEKTIFDKIDLKFEDKDLICRDGSISKEYEYEFVNGTVSLEKNPDLELAWNQAISGAGPKILVAAKIGYKTKNRKETYINGYYNAKHKNIESIKTVDLRYAGYEETTTSYLLKREIGMDENQNWRYREKNKKTILQARLDLPTKEIYFVQLFMDKNTDFERLQFSVDANGNGRRDHYILSDETNIKKHDKNGVTIYTIDIRDALRNIDAVKDKSVLMEPIVFLNMSSKNYLMDKPIQKIVFGKFLKDINKNIVSPKIYKNGGFYSALFDLSQGLSIADLRNGYLEKISITFDLDSLQELRIEKMRLLDIGEKSVPKIQGEIKNALSCWRNEYFGIVPFDYVRGFRPLMWFYFKRTGKEKRNYSKKIQELFVRDGKIIFPDKNKVNTVLGKNSQIVNTRNKEVFSTDDVEVVICQKQGVRQWQENMEVKEKQKIWATANTTANGIPENEIIALFEVTTEPIENKKCSMNTEWWIKEAEVPLVCNYGTTKEGENKGLIRLITEPSKDKRWNFVLPDVEFIRAHSLLIDETLPLFCIVTLRINSKEFEVPRGSKEFPLPEYITPLKGLNVEIKYLGDQRLLEIDAPRIKVIGLKQELQDELKKININVGGKSLKIKPFGFEGYEGRWQDLGLIGISKGDHAIEVKDNPFFKVRTVVLNTNSALPASVNRHERKEQTIQWGRVLYRLLQLLTATAIAFVIYIFRFWLKRIIYVLGLVGNWSKQIYWLLSDKAWLIFWLVSVIWLHSYGLNYWKIGHNYLFIYGDIMFLLLFWHLARVIKHRIIGRFPMLGTNLYGRESTLFFICAIGWLIVSGAFMITKFENIAVRIGVIMYFFLVAGLVIAVKEISKTHNE
jgi:hypothetical protein